MILSDRSRSKSFRKPFVIFLGLAILLSIAGSVVRASDVLEKKLGIFVQVLDIIKNDHVDKNIDYTKVMYGAVKGMLEGLGDPYTRFMEPRAFKEMGLRQGGEYSGIGIYIGIREKQLTVIAPIRATPAARAKVRAGDAILTIDGTTTEGMALDEAVTLIRGKRGSIVTLGIWRDGYKEPKEIKIARDKIVVKSAQSQTYREGKVGYLRLITFENQSAAKDFKKELDTLRESGVQGLILDLRNNGGGLLRNAVEIAGYFLGEQPVVHTVDRDGNRETLHSQGVPVWSGPMVVLINDASASASEILAGAIQDYKKGKLIGDHSFGKASVQNIRPLDDGSALLVTVAKYLTPVGRDISKKGIEPDLFVKAPDIKGHEDEYFDEFGDIFPHKDVQLGRAIEILQEEITRESQWPKKRSSS